MHKKEKNKWHWYAEIQIELEKMKVSEVLNVTDTNEAYNLFQGKLSAAFSLYDHRPNWGPVLHCRNKLKLIQIYKFTSLKSKCAIYDWMIYDIKHICHV